MTNSPTALITGAAGGIDQALVRAFGEAGYAVIATGISRIKARSGFASRLVPQ